MADVSKPLYESFSWFRDDFKTTSQVGSKLRIKGKALYATVSGNHRKYVDEELLRSARTLAGKPVTINHDLNHVIGHVLDADYEDGFIEYVAEINKPEYVRKLRDKFNLTADEYYSRWGVEPVYGVSVEANYRYHDEDCLGGTCEVEPHGIIFSALSIVEDPEKPGVSGTTLGLMEMSLTEARLVSKMLGDYTTFHGMPKRLFESYNHDVVHKFEKEKTNMKKPKKAKEASKSHKELVAEASVSSDPRAGFLMEQEEPEPCPEGEHRNEAGDCVTTEQEEEPCAEGEKRNPETGECEPTATEQEEPCPEGEKRNEEGDCVPAATEQEGGCPEGEHKDDLDNCVPDEPPHASVPEFPAVAPAVPSTPIPAVAEFRLGEPFADYTGMDDCIAKNPDKEDPAAYCASIKQQTEGETRMRSMEKQIRALRLELKNVGKAKETEAVAQKHREESLKDSIDALQETVKQLGFNIESIGKNIRQTAKQQRSDVKTINETIQKVQEQRNSDVVVIKKVFKENNQWKAKKNALDKAQCVSIGALKTTTLEHDSKFTSVGDTFRQVTGVVSSLNETHTNRAALIQNSVTDLATNYTAIRDATDKRVKSLEWKTTNTLQKVAEIDKKYPVLEEAYKALNTNYTNFVLETKAKQAKEGEKIKETANLPERIKEMEGQIDTLKKHIPANFKTTIQKPEDEPATEAVPTRRT